jgi:hypothetical protein
MCVLRASQTAYHISSLAWGCCQIFKSTRPYFLLGAPVSATTCLGLSTSKSQRGLVSDDCFRKPICNNGIVQALQSASVVGPRLLRKGPSAWLQRLLIRHRLRSISRSGLKCHQAHGCQSSPKTRPSNFTDLRLW